MEAGNPDRVTAGPEPDEFDPDEVAAIALARDRVLERIEWASRRAGRDPGEVRLIAVSKTVPAQRLRAAVAAGLTELGENRVQEAVAKAPLVPGASWHLIGPLQSNKVRPAVETFSTVETVDTSDLAARLDRIAGEVRPGRRLPVLLQVNVDADPAKAGFDPDAVHEAMPRLGDLRNLEMRGLMTVGRFAVTAEAARATFVALRRLSERLRAANPALGRELSMGMSDDFEVAVEEGATTVRIGRALFGARPDAGG